MKNARARVRLSNTPRAMQTLVERFAVFARQSRVPVGVQREMQLALDEIVSNILRHGCQDGRRHRIGVELAVNRDAGLLRVEISDDARPFNVLDVEPPVAALDAPLGTREPGGLGILLVKKLMDHVGYSRRNGLNRVVLERRFPGARRVAPRPRRATKSAGRRARPRD